MTSRSMIHDAIKQSRGMKVIIGTRKPISIQGVLAQFVQEPTGLMTLYITEPEVLYTAENINVKIGELLRLKSDVIVTYGTIDPSVEQIMASMNPAALAAMNPATLESEDSDSLVEEPCAEY